MLDQKRIIHLQESTGHSVFGPSSMGRIIRCPGSVTASLKCEPQPTSPYAEKGTLLHGYCEEAITAVGLYDSVPYVWAQPWEWDDKLLVVAALEYVQSVAALHEDPYIIKLEAKGTLAEWGLPEVYGTMDVQIISLRRVDVLDYKFGHGIQVFAKQNPQCACYLAGSVPFGGGAEPMAKLFVHIVQPTKDHYDPWEVPWTDLTTIILGDVQEAVNNAKKSDPDYACGVEQCRWCDAKLKCKVRMKGVRTNASRILEAAKDPNTVPQEQWVELLVNAKLVEQAIKDCREHANVEIESGRGFAGFKHIKGKNARFFEDKEKGEAYIKKSLGKKAFKPTPALLVTLAQAEKLDPALKKDKKWEAMIKKKSGKPQLVPASDPREGIVYNVESVFTEDDATSVSPQAGPFESSRWQDSLSN